MPVSDFSREDDNFSKEDDDDSGEDDDDSGEDNDDSDIKFVKRRFKSLARSLRKMFVIDAKKRPDTKELLEDEWV